MRLFHKIFLCFVVIFGIAFQAAGYLLINFAYENAVEQEKKIAFQDYRYNRYILQSILYTDPDFFEKGKDDLSGMLGRFTVPVRMCEIEGKYDISNMTMSPEGLPLDREEGDGASFQIYKGEKASYIFVCDYVRQGGKELYLVTQTDISAAVARQRSMIAYFQRIYLIILCVSFPIIFLLTKVLTASLQKVREAAGRIAQGSYSQRIQADGKDEISELAADFNRMAEQVEEKMAKLSDMAKQKEDFAANFAHELKTPLTSVIGYADMLYQHDLPREEVRSAASYIWNEGMRLNALSLKLMDLFVLHRQEFLLEEMPAGEIFENLRQGIEPVCGKQGVELCMEIEEGSIWVDFDLFKTMLLNLADNSVKAGCSRLWVSGRPEGEGYRVEVRDNGKGIPPEELGRITEAFYMVDKSRSRKQHGAGLGLALVAKIVEVHGAKMELESDGQTGTAVVLSFGEADRAGRGMEALPCTGRGEGEGNEETI